MSQAPVVHGFVAQGFEPVRDAFAQNLASGEELGATFSVVQDGETIIDLYGGVRDEDHSEPLGPDDLFNVWSTTKGMAAISIGIAVERGLLDYRAPVAIYWPEFAVNGKEAISVETLLSHASGIQGADTQATTEELLDIPAFADRLASQAPLFPPGSANAYNAGVFGHWVDALLRRTDGRSLKDFFADEVAIPLKADVWIGLPEDQHHRRAPIVAPWAASLATAPPQTDPIIKSAMGSPRMSPLQANRPDWIAAGNGAAGGSANARGIARVYGALARGGELDGVRIISPEGVALASAQRREGKDKVLGVWVRWAAGFILSSKGLYGPNDTSFGHSGWGGSFGFADPVNKLGVSYAMNLMAPNLAGDPRGGRLVTETYRCLGLG
jgi:CubicO group peptidase (beta-lactamase class C family)